MEWNIRNDLPIYTQLTDQIKLGIASGLYAPGERLASVRDMAMEAGVNPNTMQRALQELEREGLVFTQRTAGRFVTEEPARIDAARAALAREQVERFLEAMGKLGYHRADIFALIAADNKEE